MLEMDHCPVLIFLFFGSQAFFNETMLVQSVTGMSLQDYQKQNKMKQKHSIKT